MSDLRQRVAHAMWHQGVDAAIAIVLEEAAQCAESHNARGSCLDPRYPSPREIAAAIRALAGGKTHE